MGKHGGASGKRKNQQAEFFILIENRRCVRFFVRKGFWRKKHTEEKTHTKKHREKKTHKKQKTKTKNTQKNKKKKRKNTHKERNIAFVRAKYKKKGCRCKTRKYNKTDSVLKIKEQKTDFLG